MSIENEDESHTEIVSPSSNVIIRLSTSGGAQSLLGLDGLGGGDGVELLSVDNPAAHLSSIQKCESEKMVVVDVIQEFESIHLETKGETVMESTYDSILEFNSLLETLPSQVRDQWRKGNRSLSSTDGSLGIEAKSNDLLNALLIIDDDGYRYSRSTDVSVLKTHGKEAKWSQFFENTRLLDEIRKDVDR